VIYHGGPVITDVGSVGATVKTPMSDTTLSKEMSPKSDDERN